MSGPEIVTLGCRLNLVESEAMRALAHGQDELVIVNSCAVTAEAVAQARKEVRRAARRRPGARIVVTGCAAQLDPAAFAAMPEVAAVIGNREKWNAAAFARSPAGTVAVSDMAEARDAAPQLVTRSGTHARAFVAVQNGCDHRCTFCIIPFARGPSRSVPEGQVVEQVRLAVEQGCREVVLTGVDLTDYGRGLFGAPSLGRLVEHILRQSPELPRLRLSSLDSVEIDDRLFALLAGEPRVQPYLHLSLQHGDDLILKRMKRRHGAGQAIDLVRRLKAARPEIAVGADLIAGFPTESEAAAQNTLALLDACDIVFGHVFPYSARPGTPAARMPQLDPALVRARAARLRLAADARRRRWLESLIGSRQDILVETGDGRGHVGNHARAKLAGGGVRGVVAKMRVTRLDGDTLVGDPV